MKRYVLGAVLSIGVFASPAFTQAAALTDTQVQAILSLLSSFGADTAVVAGVKATLTGGGGAVPGEKWCHTFNSDLKIGDSGKEVAALHRALFKEGISASETGDSFDSRLPPMFLRSKKNIKMRY